MLEVLLREEVSNVCVVVTRYFGGILLGAPGLIRAYTRGCTEALHAAGLVMFRPFVEVEASFSYAAQGRVDYALSGQTVLKRNYGANVTLNLLLAEADVDKVHEVLLNLTSGMLTWKIIQECMEPTDASGKPIKRK